MSKPEDFIVAPFKQGEVARKYYGDGTEEFIEDKLKGGICYALCGQWISRHRRFKSEGPEKRIAWLKREESIVDAVQTQIFAFQATDVIKLVKAEGDFALGQAKDGTYKGDAKSHIGELTGIVQTVKSWDHQAVKNKAYEAYGLTRSSTNLSKEPLSDITIADRTKGVIVYAGSVHTYHLLDLYKSGGGGHAIACYKSGGSLVSGAHLYMFDPNFGEYKVKEKQVAGFIADVLSFYMTRTGMDQVSVSKVT